MDHLLSIRHLTLKGRSDESWVTLLDDISLDLRKGEVLGLIGESGAGKSTLGLAAMCYTRTGCRITEGSIVFDGKELVGTPREELLVLRGSRIAYVAQSAAASFNPAHQLVQQFAETPIQHGHMDFEQARQKAEDLYRRLQLPDPERIGYRYPHQVSGGQLQRAMVAMAMACDPDIIVFDEPTTALDVTTQIEVLAAIKEAIKLRNTAAIYITHDLAVVSQVADRIMVLRYGKLVEEGETRKLIDSPEEAYTRDLLNVRRQKKKMVPPAKDAVLSVSGLTAGYNKFQNVVEDISFDVRKGRTVAVVGESGSGKTSLARVITGLLPPSEGRISFNGDVLTPQLKGRSKEILRRLRMVYQMPDVALNPRQKIRRILGRPLEFFFKMGAKAKKKKVLELLEMIEMGPEFYDRYPSELSGGQKQRICIARALASQPDLIICDEVTSALDQLVAEGILKLLQRLQDELGVSYLFITHDLATVKAIADDVIVMLQGKIVEQGPRDEMFTPPHHDYTQRLFSSVPEMDPDWLDNLLECRVGENLGFFERENETVG
ncbi:MAG: ABC transporter ATP-binding protein [Desulfosarcina sp.]|nr:ABC transporter ATP-binding protein [Desulfosarcina sp.]MBC2764755.1 ABC transporter ATP-binding protein [Desulfosarcina sp.]